MSGIVPVKSDALPRSLVALYKNYAFDNVDRTGGFAYDTIGEWQSVTRRVSEVFLSRLRAYAAAGGDRALIEAEVDHARKLGVCWRDRGFGSVVQAEPIEVSNPSQASALSGFLRSSGSARAAMIRQMPTDVLSKLYLEAPVPVAKGKGAPYWFSATDRDSVFWLARMAEGSRTADELVERVWSAANARVRPCLTAYIRIQAANPAKEQARWIRNAGGILRVGTRPGPKVRKVQALPFVFNYAAATAAWVMKYTMQHIGDANTGRIDDVISGVAGWPYITAFDLSGYDDTVAIETLTAYREYVLAPCLHALVGRGVISSERMSLLLSLDEMQQTLPLLTPPVDENFGAQLVATRGGIKSGERLTSDKGTEINKARIRWKIQKADIEAKFFNWGDDTLVCTKSAAAKDRYMAVDDEALGFKETIAEEPSFLMRRVPENYAYVGRMLASTINKEVSHEARNTAIAAAGIAIRMHLLRGHPISDAYQQCLLASGSPRLQVATEIASRSDPIALSTVAGKTATRVAGGTVPAEDLVDDLVRAGLVPEEIAPAYLDQISEAAERSYMPANEIRAESLKLTIADAARMIRTKAYTTR